MIEGALKEALEKMCEIAGHQYHEIDFKDEEDPFYTKYTWSEKQQDVYREWFIQKLIEDKKFRNELSKFPSLAKRKETAVKMANEFILNYGFRCV